MIFLKSTPENGFARRRFVANMQQPGRVFPDHPPETLGIPPSAMVQTCHMGQFCIG
jgi:hypothetical protein